jgi:plastocyanin
MRRSRALVLVLASLLVLALAACSYGTSTPSGTTGGTTGGGTPSASVTVSMKNIAFNPAQVDVTAGGSVTFVNDDSVQHNVAGDTWSSGPLDPGKSFTQTFPTAGANAVRCTIHPSMTMTVNVK